MKQLKGQSHELRMRDFLPRNTHGVISRHYRYGFVGNSNWVIYVIFKSETGKSNVFPLRKVNLKTLKALNAKGLAASGGKVRVIVVASVKAVSALWRPLSMWQ